MIFGKDGKEMNWECFRDIFAFSQQLAKVGLPSLPHGDAL